MSTITDIATPEQWAETLEFVAPSTLIIASFHTPWAAPCVHMATVLSTLASEYPVTDPLSTKWVSINAEELGDISEAYDVTAVPFLILLRNGQVIETVSGSSAVKVRDAVEKHTQSSAAASLVPVNGTEETERNGTEQKEAHNSNPIGARGESPAVKGKADELSNRLYELTNAAPVMLFMKGTPRSPECGFSRQIVAILREHSVKFGFFNILADDEIRQSLKVYADWPTYPQLWVDGDLIGGLDIVKEALVENPDFFDPYRVDRTAEAAP